LFSAINDADYVVSNKVPKKEKDREKDTMPTGAKRGRPPNPMNTPPPQVPFKKGPGRPPGSTNQPKGDKASTSKAAGPASASKSLSKSLGTKAFALKTPGKKPKEKDDKVSMVIKKEDEDLRGLEELYYGISDGTDEYYEMFPYSTPRTKAS